MESHDPYHHKIHLLTLADGHSATPSPDHSISLRPQHPQRLSHGSKREDDDTSDGTSTTPLVVSMRPYKIADVPRIVELTTSFPHAHGAPVHVGQPGARGDELLGIVDLRTPDYGDDVGEISEKEVPVFWACGVTSQRFVRTTAGIDFAICHKPGCMLVLDVLA